MQISRTNTKGYIGTCSYPECQYTTKRYGLRVKCADDVRFHSRRQHGFDQREDKYTMKTPSKDLPPQDKLSDFDGNVIVISSGKKGKRNTSFGDRTTVEANVWVYVDGSWRDLGETPIFFSTVQRQVLDLGDDEEIGGVLHQGTDRNPREWVLLPATSADDKKALKEWSKDAAF